MMSSIHNQKIALIVNTHSRKGRDNFFAALDYLMEKDIEVTSFPVHDPKHLSEIAKKIAEEQFDVVIIGGGDGTVSTAIDHFVYSKTKIGILPLGTANSFVRSLAIPLDLQGALDVIIAGKSQKIDLGKIGEDYFANTTVIGYSAAVARSTSKKLKKILGIFGFIFSAIKVLFTHKHIHCEIEFDGEKHSVRTHQIIIANGSHYGFAKVRPDAELENRELIIFTMNSVSRWQIVRMWFGLLTGNHLDYSEVRDYRVQKATLKCDPVKEVDIDGEFKTQTPIEISVAKDAVEIFVK